MSLVDFACPRCLLSQSALAGSQPMHECPKNGNKITVFTPSTVEPTKEKEAMAPQTTKNQISKGSAPRAAAKQKAHVQESADKLAALKERQAAAAVTDEQADDLILNGTPLPSGEQAKAPTTAKVDEGKAAGPRPRLTVAGKPVPDVHNRLSGISRATSMKGGERLATDALRALMVAGGIADPDHGIGWSFELPNGVVIASVLDAGSVAASRALKAKAAPKAKLAKAKA